MAGGASAANAASPARVTVSAPTSTPSHDAWHRAVSRTRAPKPGCFQVKEPSTELVEVPCGHGPMVPLLPGSGPRHAGGGKGTSLVGGGGTNDFAGQVAGTIHLAEASFPSVNNLTSETDSQFGAGAYSLQLNSEPFPGAPQCAGAADPAVCTGWQQFVYQGEWLFIEYWLLDYGQACPTGWTQFNNTNVADTIEQIDCVQNTPGMTFVGTLPITDLPYLNMTVLSGSFDGQTNFDQVELELALPGKAAQTWVSGQNTVLNLANNWTSAEFNVFGFGGGSQANFNSDATINVALALETQSGTPPYAPACESESFTGETNNLTTLSPCCAVDVNPNPPQEITFSESNAGSLAPTPAVCPLYLNVNNSPLQLTQGGTSEAYVLMYGPWMTQDHGTNATGVVLANDAPGVTIQIAPGTTIDSAGAVNLTATASATTPLGSYQATIKVTDQASGTSFIATIPIEVICLQSIEQPACTPAASGAAACGVQPNGCGTVIDCGQCTNGACENGFCPCIPVNTCGNTCATSIVNNCGATVECSCSGGDTCSSGICCPTGQTNSNGLCCPSGETNSNGLCCPSGDFNSDGHCCTIGDSWNGSACVAPSKGGSSSGGGGCHCTKTSCNCE